MSKNLGFRTAVCTKPAASNNPFGTGLWVGVIDPSVWAVGGDAFEVYHIALKGPATSTLEVWIDQAFYSTTPRGDVNEWDPKQPLFMKGGQTLYFYWNSGGFTPSGGNPMVTVWIRQPTIL